MPRFNDKFELSVEDVDLIEKALRRTKRSLDSRAGNAAARDGAEKPVETMRQIHELLGRLHNQKVFYRPQDGTYIGG